MAYLGTNLEVDTEFVYAIPKSLLLGEHDLLVWDPGG